MRIVTLASGHAKPLWHGHPWVYAKSVARVTDGEGPDDDWARVLDADGRLVGHGLWSATSALRVRLLTDRSVDPAPEPDALLAQRIRRADAHRRMWFPEGGDTDAYRLVHAEADGLPGLVVDRYGAWLVAQWATAPIYARRAELARVLLDATGAKGLTSRAAGHEAEEGIPADAAPLVRGEAVPDHVVVRERGLDFEIQPTRGQKTGHYTDQRENRARVARYAENRDVLDLFCGAGGFSMHALHAGARHALGVDSGRRAIEAAARNAKRAGYESRFEGRQVDVGEALRQLKAADRQFGLVVCDPPNLIPTRAAAARAVRPWRELLVRSLTRVEPGGLLAACSCTPRMGAADLLALLRSAARDCRRPFRVLETLAAGPDHPVLPTAPNTRYLSGHLIEVEPW